MTSPSSHGLGRSNTNHKDQGLAGTEGTFEGLIADLILFLAFLSQLIRKEKSP